MVEYKLSGSIRNTREGLVKMAQLFEFFMQHQETQIRLNFEDVGWFGANYAAILGAVIDTVPNAATNVQFENMSEGVRGILNRNGFLAQFGGGSTQDTYGTTIPYIKFDGSASTAFEQYLRSELINRTDLPNMTPLLKKKILENIIEIFNNASFHGHTDHVYCCGQFFPASNRIDFTVVNLGRTIKHNVSNYFQQNVSGSNAIEWATREGTTTRTGTVPGGLGLYTLRTFLRLNKGKVQIFSDDGFWIQGVHNINFNDSRYSFGGTIVNLEFNTADTNNYQLVSESTADDIF